MNNTFDPSGVVTITTDFGHRGPFVGVMKGVILSRFPAAAIVDLTHEAHVHWPAEAGFWISRSYHYFPVGSVHLAIVDPGVGTPRDILLALGDGQAFLAPDNGLLAEVIERTSASVYTLSEEVIETYCLENTSATFHGRDIFAPLVAALASGVFKINNLGEPTVNWIPSIVERPELRGSELVGIVITTDHFGNLISNITPEDLVGFANPSIVVGGHKVHMGRTYGDVSPGDMIALINSFGVLEIACAEQNAGEFLGIGRGAPVRVKETA